MSMTRAGPRPVTLEADEERLNEGFDLRAWMGQTGTGTRLDWIAIGGSKIVTPPTRDLLKVKWRPTLFLILLPMTERVAL